MRQAIMNRLFLSILLLAFSGAVNAQADAKYLVNLKGIGLGSDYSDVIKAFGKPKTETTAEGDECRGGKIRTLVYDGMELELNEPSEPETEFYVHAMEITNAKRLPFGLKIGATQAAVKRKLGSPTAQETDDETGERVWYYSFDESDGPGTTNFYFKKGKLIRIFTMYMC
jgi:hypothetical protein